MFERLSSAKRINRAADDAAVLSISERLKAAIATNQQAIRNLGDGMSLVGVAEGALEETSGSLVRMRELVMTASNGTLGDAERAMLQDEFDGLVAEITRTSNTTDFNGIKVLSGELTGADALILEDGSRGPGPQIEIADLSAAALGLEGLDVSDPASLDAIDAAQQSVSGARGRLGTIEHTLQSQSRSLRIQHEGNVAANSRLADTDFALEMAVSTGNTILREYQAALIAQANLSSDLALRLLA